ncbi:MAG: type II toxin-antitoxin system RelE/ParE family toxin [Clostridia bacterium]|nr:type II toxin-antitoxin system RelE/ParE family toxin [Clostridia bacterium]
MKYTVNLSPEAVKDINGIFEYIAVALGEKETAVNMINLIEKKILSLDEMLGRHKVYNDEPWKSRGVHIMPVKKYLVFYVVDESNNSVNVFRVIYGSRDIEKILK